MQCQTHEYEKIILAKRFKNKNIQDQGFIWYRCKTCGFMKPSMFPCDLDKNGKTMSSNLKRVKENHPNYQIVWEEK